MAGQRRRERPVLPARRAVRPGTRTQARPPLAGSGRRDPRQLRTLAQRTDGTITWRTSVPRPERSWINDRIRDATELLAALDVHDTTPLATATQDLIDTLNQTIATLNQAVTAVASSAHTAGIPLDHLATWTHIPAEDLQHDIANHQADIEDQYGYRRGPAPA